MTRRRSRGGASLVVISWRDIPAQVTATAEGRKETRMLDDRFQHAIDRAAGVAGLTDTQSYVAQWQRTTHPLTDDPASEVAIMVDQLHATYDRVTLENLVAAGGLAAAAQQAGHEPESEQ